MSDQPTRELTADELKQRKEQIEKLVVNYNEQLELQKPRTKLAKLRAAEVQANANHLEALMKLHATKNKLRQLALEMDLITVEEATQVKNTKNPGPDRN